MNKIYVIKNKESFDKIKDEFRDEDVLIVCGSESIIEKQITFDKSLYSDSILLNNRVLEIGDILFDLGPDYKFEIFSGDFLLVNYLVAMAQLLKIKISIQGNSIPSFQMSIDREEISIFKGILKEIIIDEVSYKKLPYQWKAIYYKENDKYIMSRLWRSLIDEAS